MSSTKPRILVFAGPNGSGKSTITQNIKPVGLYINADDIKQDAGCSALEAAQEAESLRQILLAAKKDFTFETVLSTERNLLLLEEAKTAGYEIFAVFVLTNDSGINIQRVKHRAAAGGHDVPEEKIVSRYKKALKNISKLIRIADHTRIIDNTGDTPSLICEINGDTVTISENEFWTKQDILCLL